MINLSELERLAERAVGYYGDLEEDVADAHGDFIAAANPETVKALVAALKGVEAAAKLRKGTYFDLPRYLALFGIELGPESKPPTETTSGRTGPR